MESTSHYSVITIPTVLLCCLVFCCCSIRSGRWYYVFTHPYMAACLMTLLAFYKAADIPGCILFTDCVIASSFLCASLLFWVGYRFFDTEKWIRRMEKPLALFSDRNDDGTTSRKAVDVALLFGALIIVFYWTFFPWFFGGYGHVIFSLYTNSVSTIHKQAGEIAFRAFTLTHLMILVLMYCLPCLVITLAPQKNAGRQSGFPRFLFAFLLFSAAATTMGLDGTRTPLGVASVLLFILLIFRVFATKKRLTLGAYALCFLFWSYCFLFITFLPLIRGYGINSLNKALAGKTVSQNIQTGILKGLNAETHKKVRIANERLEFSISDIVQPTANEPEDIAPEKIAPETGTPEVIKTPSSVDVTPSVLKPDPAQDRETLLAKQKNQIKYYRPSHRGCSPEVAWIMLYYGKHADFLGITYPIKQCFYRLFLNRFLKEPLRPTIRLVFEERGQWKSGTSVTGNVGMGYMSYGFVGAYFYSCLFGFLAGFLAKFAIEALQNQPRKLEMQACGLLTYFFSVYMLATGFDSTMAFQLPLFFYVTIIFVIHVLKSCLPYLVKYTYSQYPPHNP